MRVTCFEAFIQNHPMATLVKRIAFVHADTAKHYAGAEIAFARYRHDPSQPCSAMTETKRGEGRFPGKAATLRFGP